MQSLSNEVNCLRIKKLLESRRNTSDTAARYHYDDMILRINTALGLKD